MSATQFLVIGDTHQRSADPRNPQRLRALDQAIEHGLSLPRLGGWVWLGDIFHTTTTPEDRNAMIARALRMGAVAPVFVPAGNHDPKGELDVFGCLNTRYPIIVRDVADVVTVELATGEEATAFLLPWPSAASLLAKGVAPADIQAAAREALDALFIDAAAKLEAARQNGHVTFFAGHATIVGSIASSGQPQGDQGVAIDAAMLARLGPCQKLAGHIHAPQTIATATYAGSVSRGDFGETEDKRFLVVTCTEVPACDICGFPATCFGAYEGPESEPRYACNRCCGHGNDDGWCKPVSEGGVTDARHTWVYDIESVPLRVPRLWHLEGTFESQQLTWRVTNGPDGDTLQAPLSFEGDEVRLRVRIPHGEKTFFDAAVDGGLVANFQGCASFKLEPVVIPDRAVRAPEVAAARTTREKVTAWATVTNTAITDDVLSVNDRLEGTPPDTLLAEVQQEVDAIVNPARETEAMVA